MLAACDSAANNDDTVQPDAAMGSGSGMADASTPVGPTRPPGVALCYSATAEAHPAVVAFRTALRTNDRASRADVIDALDGAVGDLPNEEEAHLFLALAHLWRLAEPLAGENGLLAQYNDATAARDHLRTAYDLCPTDYRIAAWLGPVLVQMGKNLYNQNTVDEGIAILDEGIAHYPTFVLFSKLLVYADSPRTSPEFTAAFDAVVANLGACAQAPNDPACTNLTVPHNFEGGGLFMGDAFTKALHKTDAQTAYQGVMSGAGYATWSYGTTVTDRLQQLDSRINLYSNANTDDDPPAAWGANNQCALCHQE
jgi:hypothetical protein